MESDGPNGYGSQEQVRHARETHSDLTAMATLDRKVVELQQEMTEQKKLLTNVQTDLSVKIEELSTKLDDLKGCIQELQHTSRHIEANTGGGTCSGCEVLTFPQYSNRKRINEYVFSDPFYSHHHGYKFRLRIGYSLPDGNIGVYLCLIEGEYDDELPWPVDVKVQLELLNQAGDHHHVVRTKKEKKWEKNVRDTYIKIDPSLMKYPDLEKRADGVQYMMNDCLKFRICVDTKSPDNLIIP